MCLKIRFVKGRDLDVARGTLKNLSVLIRLLHCKSSIAWNNCSHVPTPDFG